MPGAARLLWHLHSHGIPMALATSTSRATYEAKMCGKAAQSLCCVFQAWAVQPGKLCPALSYYCPPECCMLSNRDDFPWVPCQLPSRQTDGDLAREAEIVRATLNTPGDTLQGGAGGHMPSGLHV